MSGIHCSEPTTSSTILLSITTKAKLLTCYFFDGTPLPSFLVPYTHLILAFSGGGALAYFFQRYRQDKEKIQLAIFHVLKVVEGLSQERLRDPGKLAGEIQGVVRSLLEKHLTSREAWLVMKECKRRVEEMTCGDAEEERRKEEHESKDVGGKRKRSKASAGSKKDDEENSLKVSIIVKKNRDITVAVENVQHHIASRVSGEAIQKPLQEKKQTLDPTLVSRASFCASLQEGQAQGKLLQEKLPHPQTPNSSHTTRNQLQHDKQPVNDEMMDIDDGPVQVQNRVVSSNPGPDRDTSARIPTQTLPSPARITTDRKVETPKLSRHDALRPLLSSHSPSSDSNSNSHAPTSAPQPTPAPSKGYGFSYDDTYLYPTSSSSSSSSKSSKSISTRTAVTLPNTTNPPSLLRRNPSNTHRNSSSVGSLNKGSISKHKASTDITTHQDNKNRTLHHNSAQTPTKTPPHTPTPSKQNKAHNPSTQSLPNSNPPPTSPNQIVKHQTKQTSTSPPAAKVRWSSPLLEFSDTDNEVPTSPLRCVSISPLGDIPPPPSVSPVSVPSLSPQGGD